MTTPRIGNRITTEELRALPVGAVIHGNPLELVREQLNHEGVLAENLEIRGVYCDNCELAF